MEQENSFGNADKQSGPRKPGLGAFCGTLFSQFILEGGTAFSGILAARLLGPESRGQLAAVILWPSVIATLGLLGTNWATARASASGDRAPGEVAAATVFLALALSVVSVIAGWFLVPVLLAQRPEAVPLARLYLVCFVPLNYLGLNLGFFDHGRGNFYRANWTRVLHPPAYVALILLAWFAGQATVPGFLIALLGANAVVAVVRLVCLWREPMRWRLSPKMVRTLLLMGGPFAASAVAMLLAGDLDRAIVVLVLDDRQVGLYAVALSFAAIFSGVSTSLGAVTFSRSAQTTDPEEMAHFVAETFRRSLLVGVALGCTAAAVAPLLIRLLYGSSFQAASLPGVLLALGSSFLFPAWFMDQALRGQGRPLCGVITKVSAAGIVAALAVPLVPRWGIVGMAIAVSVGKIADAVALSVFGRWFFGLRFPALWLPGLSDVAYLLAVPGRLLAQVMPPKPTR